MCLSVPVLSVGVTVLLVLLLVVVGLVSFVMSIGMLTRGIVMRRKPSMGYEVVGAVERVLRRTMVVKSGVRRVVWIGMVVRNAGCVV